MAIDLQILHDEIDPVVNPTGHPVTGAYSLDDATCADELNAFNLPSSVGADPQTIARYLQLETKGGEYLWGRIQIVAESAVGSDPIGEATPLTLEHITSAKAILAILDPGAFRPQLIDPNDSRFDTMLSNLGAGSGCKAIRPADVTAIKAMVDNMANRVQQITNGTTSKVRVGEVAQARAL